MTAPIRARLTVAPEPVPDVQPPDPSDLALAAVIAQVHATLAEQQPWRSQAACRGMTDRFFANRHDQHSSPGRAMRKTEAARTVCARCPVIDQCRAYLATIQTQALHGVWAGTSWRDRRGRNKRTV